MRSEIVESSDFRRRFDFLFVSFQNPTAVLIFRTAEPRPHPRQILKNCGPSARVELWPFRLPFLKRRPRRVAQPSMESEPPAITNADAPIDAPSYGWKVARRKISKASERKKG